MKKLSLEKTIIIIAHSPLAIKYSDHLIILENGKVKEEGEAKYLISKNEILSKLFNI